MHRLLRSCLLLVLTVGVARAAVAAPPSPAVVRMIADLGCLEKPLREAAEQRLKKLPRAVVLDAAAALASGQSSVATSDSQVYSPASMALRLLADAADPRAASIALGLSGTLDPDLRNVAAEIVGGVKGEAANGFLARALGAWGERETAGLRPLFHALDDIERMRDPHVRKTLVAFLASPLPPADPRFRYDSEHDPPRDGDNHRLWLFKADGCLFLIRHFPFDDARAGVERCVAIPNLRVEAIGALAEVGGPQATPRLRQILASSTEPEQRLAVYHALFGLAADTEADRLDARNLFTATVAPSTAWVQGLGAMVALFEARGDEPALRVVRIWKLSGEAAAVRDEALQTMRRAHPEVYDRAVR